MTQEVQSMPSPEVLCSGREEEIAALIDDGLPAGERASLIEHLADCEVCYEIFTETASLQEEDIGPALRQADVLVHPRSATPRRLYWMLPAAAAALLAVIYAPDLADSLGGDPLASASLTATFDRQADLADRLNDNWADTLRSENRGMGIAVPKRETAFQLGALVVALDLALRTAEREPCRQLTNDLQELLNGTVLIDLEHHYREIETQLETQDLATLVSKARAAEQDLEAILPVGLDVRYFHLGKWVEAAWLAAMVGDESFFTRRAHRRVLQSLVEELGQEAPPELQEIVELAGRELDRVSLETLEDRLSEILRSRG